MTEIQNIENVEKLEGLFTYCIYKSFSYAVYRFEDNIDGNIIVTGNIQDIDLKSEYILYGNYVNHPKYGFQFQVIRYDQKLPSSYDGIIAYLSSDLFKGIGKKKAQKIVDRYGLDTLKLIHDDPSLLYEIGIKEKDVNTISDVLNSNLQFEDSFYFLIGLGLSPKELNKIIAYYKVEAKNIIESNPYQPYFDIYGIGFKKCEEIATKLSFDPNNKNRLIALIAYIANELSFRSGNTYLSYVELRDVFYRVFDKNAECDFDYALNLAIEDKKIFVEDDRYYHFSQYTSECINAAFLVENNLIDECDDSVIKNEISLLESAYSIKYADKQKEAILEFYRNKISLIVGGPGTGKTTIVKALVESMRNLHPTYELHVVAPTGRAAKRISELCDVSSSTIHSLLKWDKETNTFSYGIDNPLLLDVLIIDEFSMVDNWLFAKLVSALPLVKKICIIGDDNQLPSVGPGNLLKDIIDSNSFALTRLETIFRQEEQSDIIRLSNDILNNNVDFERYKKDIIFVEDSLYDSKNELINFMHQFLDEGYVIADLQVLAPMYKGHLGIDTLNDLLQSIFNPPSKSKNEFNTKYRLFREGDKILQLKNQNADDVYNGDIGEIIEINNDKNKFELIAKFDDIFVEYSSDDVAKIALAYCVSVHKSQGSEYPIVFFAFSNQHNIMLNKNLIYTAVSRASNKLIIIGNQELFKNCAKRAMKIRKTSLKYFIDNYFKN